MMSKTIEAVLKKFGGTRVSQQDLMRWVQSDASIDSVVMTEETKQFKVTRFLYDFPSLEQYAEKLGVVEVAVVEDIEKELAEMEVEPKTVFVPTEQADISVNSVYRHIVSDAPPGYYIPTKHNGFVAFGEFRDLVQLIRSGEWLPTIISGESGNGKTLFVRQACAMLQRELVMVSITSETDEEDLMGSIGLKDGATVMNEGPVVTAMRRGAVLLLDELDYASGKIACLQNILNGGSYTFKKTGQVVHPAVGFMIIATMNTKGKSDETGRYVNTNVMNEAFLDRFPMLVEQKYPSIAVEKKILSFVLQGEDEFIDCLTKWADQIRRTYDAQGCTETITTRRLVTIASIYRVYQEREKAIRYAVARFDQSTIASFVEIYKKIDPNSRKVKTKVTPGTVLADF